MRGLRFVAGLLALVLLASCGGGNDSPVQTGVTAVGSPSSPFARAESTPAAQPARTATPSPSPTPSPAPTPAAEVAYVYVDPDSRLLRFVGLIRNDSAKTIEQLRVRWDAFDAGGAIVGSFTTAVPTILAGTTFPYVGGAGGANLSGVPETVKLTIVDGGRLTDAPSRLFMVDGVTLTTETYPIRAPEFRVAATITTGSEQAQRFDIAVTVVLRDVTGTIVGADFDRPSTIPEVVPPNTKFRSEVRVRAKGAATTAEVIAYALK